MSALASIKAALAECLGDIFTGRAKSLSAEQAKAVAEWQVPGMKPMTQMPNPEDQQLTNDTDAVSNNDDNAASGQVESDDLDALPAHLA